MLQPKPRKPMNRGTSQLRRTQSARKAPQTGKVGKDTETAETMLQGRMRRGNKPLRAKADPKLVAWGKAVKKRDGNRCQWPTEHLDNNEPNCQTGDARIDPHHIGKRSQRPDLKYDVDNGVALCRTHHEWTDRNPDIARGIGLLSNETYEKAMKQGGLILPEVTDASL